jgi:hypothetical protein
MLAMSELKFTMLVSNSHEPGQRNYDCMKPRVDVWFQAIAPSVRLVSIKGAAIFAIRRCRMVPGIAAAHDDSNSTLRVTAPIWALAIYGQSTLAAVAENPNATVASASAQFGSVNACA